MRGSDCKGPGRPLGETDPNSATFMPYLSKLKFLGKHKAK